MNLTEKPNTVNWPATHYVFVEKIGPFQETAQKCWGELHAGSAQIAKHTKITGYASLYKIEPQMIYCAGVIVDEKPESLPSGFKYMKFEGGKYSEFVLTGPYSQLPEACGKVFKIVADTKIPVRDDFFIENYVNSPDSTPPEKLITQILIPTK